MSHWALLARCSELYQALKRAALGFLISTDWLINEAKSQGVPVLDRAIREAIVRKERSFPHGRPEFQKLLKFIGHTMDDISLETQRELAIANIRGKLLRDMPRVPAAEIAHYYSTNIRLFEHPERRRFYIVENINTVKEARQLAREFSSGKKRISDPGSSLEEIRERPRNIHAARKILKAIFRAKRNEISPPVKVERFYFLVKVIRVVPAHRESLSEAYRAIARKLTGKQQRDVLARAVDALRRKWTPMTDCRRGYVVPRCRQYKDVPIEADPLGLG